MVDEQPDGKWKQEQEQKKMEEKAELDKEKAGFECQAAK
jgi:hypothetical protein